MASLRSCLLLVLPFMLATSSCGSDSDGASGNQLVDAGASDAPDADLIDSADSDTDSGPVDPPPPPSDDWCERVITGPAGDDFRLDLSKAHASVRFFGTLTHQEADDALTAALSDAAPWTDDALSSYASQLGIACALPANQQSLGAASVELRGTVAVIHPGTGTFALPPGVTAAALDLRDLPAVEGLREALDNAASLVLAEDVPRPHFTVREHHGMSDELFGPLDGFQNFYDDAIVELIQDPIPGEAAEALPLVVITADKLAPEAAAFAVALRNAKKAWIVGEDVLTTVAEADWLPVGQHGLLHRTGMLVQLFNLPDVIPADRRSLDPLVHMMEVLDEGTPPPVPMGGSARASFHTFSNDLSIEQDQQSIGNARAALLVLHGAARLFFPYFHVVGDTIDQGLIDELDALEVSTETGVRFVEYPLARLAVHLHDSHAGTFYLGSAAGETAGYLPVLLDETEDGEIVVRRSNLAGVAPGDVLLSVGGVPIADVLANAETTSPASTPGALRRNAMASVTVLHEPTTWDLRASDGTTYQQAVELADTVSSPLNAVCTRTAGPLEDLGNPSLYYINLDGGAYIGKPSATQLIAAAQGAEGLILDGRGYPGSMETWDLVYRILEQPSVVRFKIPYVNPVDSTLEDLTQSWSPMANPSFDGPVVVLIGPSTQSQAEHILMSMVSTNRAEFVGRQTAGANGNITGVMTPGAFAVSFTGMEVLFDDGSTFHGIGIEPTVEVHPTVEALANGIDPELTAAISLLTGG